MTTTQTAPQPDRERHHRRVRRRSARHRRPAGRPDYDPARSIWNGAHDRQPALIVRCAGVADVIRTVDLARSEGLPLAVRGGGHSIPGFSTVDGGIVLDLSPMTGVEVDPGRPHGDGAGRAARGRTWTPRPSSSGSR